MENLYRLVDVVLLSQEETELIPNLALPLSHTYIDLQDILDYLKSLGFQLHHAFIQLQEGHSVIRLGQEPLHYHIPCVSSLGNQIITIQYITHETMDIEEEVVKAAKRVKERKISEVLQKVAMWRSLYQDSHS